MSAAHQTPSCSRRRPVRLPTRSRRSAPQPALHCGRLPRRVRGSCRRCAASMRRVPARSSSARSWRGRHARRRGSPLTWQPPGSTLLPLRRAQRGAACSARSLTASWCVSGWVLSVRDPCKPRILPQVQDDGMTSMNSLSMRLQCLRWSAPWHQDSHRCCIALLRGHRSHGAA